MMLTNNNVLTIVTTEKSVEMISLEEILNHISSGIGRENFTRAMIEIFSRKQGAHFNVWKDYKGAFVGLNIPLPEALSAADGFENPTIGFRLNQECSRAATNCAALVIQALRNTNIEAALFFENKEAIPKVRKLDLNETQVGFFPYQKAATVLKSKPLEIARQFGCKHLGIRFDLQKIGGICDLAKKSASLKEPLWLWTSMEGCDIGAMREAQQLSNSSLKFIVPFSL
jgi:hypothetical protein